MRNEYEDSMRILLNGICEINILELSRRLEISYATARGFLDRKTIIKEETREKIAWYIWNKMNSHLLLGPEDKV